MARKTLIHKHTNLTTNNGGVLSPKLPTSGTLAKGEIAVNYKNGYETLSIENDANEVIPFGSLELTMAYTDAAILGNKPLVIEVNDTDTTVPSGTYASITSALAAGRETVVKVINEDFYQICPFSSDLSVTDNLYEFFNGQLRCEISVLDDIVITEGSSNDHYHGNIGPTGQLQNSDITIANGDKLVITDATTSGLITRASLSFDGSTTTKALTPKGTWETFLQTESDPTVPSHVKAITTGNISDWNNKLDEAYYVVNVTSDSQITPPSTASGTANHYYLDIVTAYNNGKIPIVILNQELILPFITSNQTVVLFGTTVNLYSYLITIDEDSVEIKSLIGISEADIPITQIQINGSALVPDSQIVNITSIPASIVEQNSIYRFVNDNEKSKISSAIQGIKVNGTSITPDSNKVVDITIPDGELSSTYLRSTLENEDLLLEAGDSYETAFSKLEKAIVDDEETVAAALNELNDKIKDVDTELDEESENPVQNKVITQAILDNEYVVSVALNNLNDRIQAKLDILISGTNIKTINGTSILGSGNINVSGGSGTGGSGDENVIETVKVNGTALTPDANKAVDIIVPTTLDSISDGTTRKLSNYLPLSGGTMTGAITVGSGDGKGLLFSTTSNINVSGTTNTILGFYNGTYIIGHTSYPVNIRGNATRPLYNGNQLALYSDIPSAVTESTVSGWGFTKNTGTYSKPSGGIPSTDFTSAVLTSLGKADSAIQGVKVNGTALTPDTNKVVNITSIPASIVTQDATHRFVSDTEKTTWNGKLNALQYYSETNTYDAKIETYNDIYESGSNTGRIELVSLDLMSNTPLSQLLLYNDSSRLECNYFDSDRGIVTHSSYVECSGGGTVLDFKVDNTENKVVLDGTGFKYNNKQIATTDLIPTESTVSGWGFTKNAGTITGITMNGSSKGTSGVVNLGTVLTSHLNIKTINNTSLVGTGNVTINALPTVTSSDNGKILQVVNGAWTLVTPTAIYSGTSTPNNSTGNDGDLYLQTS